jgi:hypothetical protein
VNAICIRTDLRFVLFIMPGCSHSDFRVGGLTPGETKEIRGKIYVVDANVAALDQRYEQDFPEQVASRSVDE